MEKFGQFIDKKYGDLAGSKPVERAVQQRRRQGGETPHTRLERVDAYLDRLDTIIKDERAFGLMKRKVLDRYITKSEDVPESYWISQEAEDRKLGKGADWDHAKQDPDQLANLKHELLQTVLQDQQASLEQWVDYFGSEDSAYLPKGLKYWVFRSVVGMQEMVKKKDGEREYIEFPKRSRGTVKPFPDINHEALAYVIDAIKNKYAGQGMEFEYDIQPEERAEFVAFLEKEDFSKLYAWSNELMTPIPEHLLPVTEGEWIKYEQGSDPAALVETIRGKGTGWCTAGKNTATTQLAEGDFYVYYSQDDAGEAIIPRLAIRMEGNNKIAESPRGIAYKQNIDPYMAPILEAKLKEFGQVGEVYRKNIKAMDHLTQLQDKTQNNQALSTEDLRFLYEVDGKIESFGYKKDPRIEELLSGRDVRADLAAVFNCAPAQISLTKKEALSGDIVYHYGDLDLSNLTTTEGLVLPQTIGGDLDLSSLTTAEGLVLPQTIGGYLDLSRLTTTEGLVLPQTIGGYLDLSSLTTSEKESLKKTYPHLKIY